MTISVTRYALAPNTELCPVLVRYEHDSDRILAATPTLQPLPTPYAQLVLTQNIPELLQHACKTWNLYYITLHGVGYYHLNQHELRFYQTDTPERTDHTLFEWLRPKGLPTLPTYRCMEPQPSDALRTLHPNQTLITIPERVFLYHTNRTQSLHP